ncbi:hypothetical protein C8F01DRAFT_1301550 [Mycena amicta]|nr:hypothetical protein C8F01DRAFT_1301550 [Mycena amicta]
MQFNILTAFIVASVTSGLGLVQAVAVNGTIPTPAATPAVNGDSIQRRSGAGDSCEVWRIIDGVNVGAQCQASPGGPLLPESEVAIGACVTNTDGHLSCQPGGGASQSCTFSNLEESGNSVFVQSFCRKNDGSFITQIFFDLNNCFSNSHGNLVC